MPHNRYDKNFLSMTASVSQILKLHVGDLSVRLLRQNVVSRFNTVVTLCWSLVMRDQVCHQNKT